MAPDDGVDRGPRSLAHIHRFAQINVAGIVLAIATELKLPVIYAGTGEKLEDIIPFDSASFINSLLD